MALDDSALLEMIEMLRTADGGKLMRRLLHGMLQAVVDAEATEHIGAGLHQRSTERTSHRNGTRDKTGTTAAGDLTIKIPKFRLGSFFPALLAPRRRIDVALQAHHGQPRPSSHQPDHTLLGQHPSPLCRDRRRTRHRPKA